MTAEQLGFGEKTRILFDFSRIFLLHQHEFREVISRRVLDCFGMFWLDLGYMLKAKHCRLGLLK